VKAKKPTKLMQQTVKREEQEFLELAERFQNATNQRKTKFLDDKLGRIIFGA